MLAMKKFNEFKLADQDIVHSTFYDNIHGSLPLIIYTFLIWSWIISWDQFVWFDFGKKMTPAQWSKNLFEYTHDASIY